MSKNLSMRKWHFSSQAMGFLGVILCGLWLGTINPTFAAATQIIDSHIHIYDPFRQEGVPWPDPSIAKIYRTVLPGDHAIIAKPTGVSGTVVVECSDWLEDNQWDLDRIRDLSEYYGLIGNLKLGIPEFAANLNRFAAQKKFLGIRLRTQIIKRNTLTPEILRDLRALAAKGLVLEMNVGNEPGTTLDDALAIASAVPELPIMLDHLAGASVDGKAPVSAWTNALKAVAQFPQVYCKVSGLVNQSVMQPGSLEVSYYTPLLKVLEEAFGNERLVYGSNWPVSELGGNFTDQQKLVVAYFQPRGDSVLNNVMWRNAVRFYHLAKSAGIHNVYGMKSKQQEQAFPRLLNGRLYRVTPKITSVAIKAAWNFLPTAKVKSFSEFREITDTR